MICLPIHSIASACVAGLLVVSAAAHAQTGQPPQPAHENTARLHGNDEAFITDATKAVLTQRDAARIATARSGDREVKAFAERVANDNATIEQELRAATPRGVKVPRNEPDAAALDSIRNLRGGEFDKTYIEQVALGGGQRSLSVFKAEAESGRNEKLKDAARKALPTIQEHYTMAQELAKRKHLAGATQ
ncbi:DUF4142 domain-containing protein [Paraburkholderia sp. CNPSo 3157]|uniref:DUF4142 domain-containing protein n=1 Tax=Paraburkholderia franconis TaxID=2654983 RepID=A0A7X1TG71_9BURK|nr:DUF4142 domain-containing protein [Paraburkholderia franconis]MPW18087.1 DUF4142 domain-containing protein [Paraburkholderia franconis]